MKEKNEIHYFEVSDLITQFISAFDSVVISRFDVNSRVKQKIVDVRYVYAPKQKVLHDLTNKNQHITVPVISISLTSLVRDGTRQQSKNAGYYINSSKTRSNHVPQPIPVNIGVKMSIITRYQEDMDQILANFIPYTDPYIVISWKLPEEFSDQREEIRTQVIWDENISLTQPVEMGEGLKYRNIADTSFVIKGWLFKKHPDNFLGNIFEIKSDFIPIRLFSDLNEPDKLQSDTIITDGYLRITNTSNTRLLINKSPKILLQGQNFDFIDSVYLSSDSDVIFGSLSSYGDFDGKKIEKNDYEVIDRANLIVQAPFLSSEGNITIIIENEAGKEISGNFEVIAINN